MSSSIAQTCPACESSLAENTLVCSACRRLVHADELNQLASRAQSKTDAGDLHGALSAWQRALELLPANTTQHRAVAERVGELQQRIAVVSKEHASHAKWKGLVIVGPLIVFLLTKGKFLLLGLANITTLSTMLASVGVLWTLYGWKFALGLIVSIYIHEMGHVAAIRRFGMSASAPMFIPGFGAFVRLNQKWLNAAQDARIGLAGPRWGLAAAIGAWIIFRITGEPIWNAIAAGGAWLNLLNLVPVWNLDGGRGFRALTRGQRVIALCVFLIAGFATSEGLLFVLAIGGAYRLFTKDDAATPDHPVLAELVVLTILLAYFGAGLLETDAFAPVDAQP